MENHFKSIRDHLPSKVFLWMLIVLLAVPAGASVSMESEKLVSLNVKEMPLKQFVKEIRKATQLDVVYASEDLDPKYKVTYSCSQKPVSTVLTETLGPCGLTFKFDRGIITIFKVRGEMSTSSSSSSAASSQPTNSSRSILGKVVDSLTGEALPGATIKVSDSTIGTATDMDGTFALSVPAEHSSIEISFIGYQPMTVSIKGEKPLNVALEAATSEIDEVVVNGVFTRKHNVYSGAVNTIKSEKLKQTGNLNVLQAIGSIDPSFQILVNDEMGSNPNALPDIQMRGAASFSDMKNNYTSSPNQPLFIVDGFEQDIQKVFDMDMNRVESVTLLKDATAKALYGSKGANGVVVIETKQPQQGRLRVSYSGDLNIQTPILSDYRRTNAAEKLEVERLAGLYADSYPETQLKLMRKYNFLKQEIERGVNTDWLAQPTQVGVGQKHTLSVDGGDDVLRYSLDISYNDVDGVMKGSYRQTFNGGFNISYRYKNLLFKEQLTVTSGKGEESPYGNFSDYTMMNPYWRVRDAEGRLIERFDDYGGYNTGDTSVKNPIYNPMINAQTNYKNQDKYLDLTNNFFIDWTIYRTLRAVGRLSITKKTTKGDLFYPSNYATLNPSSPYNFRNVKPDAADDAYLKRGLYQNSDSEMLMVSSDITLNYSQQWGKHLLFANTQYSVSQNTTEENSYEGQGFADNATSIGQARQYRENGMPMGQDTKVHEMGIIASLNYSYDSRYMIDANYRASASSLFGKNNRWGHFWSAGAGWNVHYEPFMKEVKWIDNLKVRGSIGYSGSQNFSPYQAIASYEYFTDKTFDDVIGAFLKGLPNPDLKWQQTEDRNIGFDLSCFRKFDLTFDYYVKNTSNLLTPVTVVPSNGFDSYTENLGESRNEGIELRLNYRFITDSKRDINLGLFGSLAHNKNKLMKINSTLSAINEKINEEQNNAANGGAETIFDRKKPRVEYAEGVSMSAIWGVRSLGINPYDGTEILLDKDGNRTITWNAEDKVVLGDALPKIQGNFGGNLDFKGITVNVNFNYRWGGQYYNQTLVDNVENADLQWNVDRRVFTDRWNPETPGVPAKFKALSAGTTVTNPTSRFVQDYNELKLSTLNIGYDFRNTNFIRNNDWIEHLAVSLAMNDLFRLSTVKAERGLSYPYARSFIFSMQATF